MSKSKELLVFFSDKTYFSSKTNDYPKNLRIWRSLETLEKSQKLREAESSTQSFFQKKNITTTGQKVRRNRYQSFLALSNFPLCLHMVLKIFSLNLFLQLVPVSFKLRYFFLLYHESVSETFNVNIV